MSSKIQIFDSINNQLQQMQLTKANTEKFKAYSMNKDKFYTILHIF